MDARENWNRLQQRIREENETIFPGLLQIHMGAFEDLRKSGRMITANGQPVNILAPTLDPDERFSFACQIGRSLIDAHSGTANGKLAEFCAIQKANCFPNCIAIALGAILENVHPGIPGMKLTVLCNYDIIKGDDDLLIKNISVLQACFPWSDIKLKVTEKEPPSPVNASVIPLDQMNTLFQADAITKIDTARTSFSGRVLRGELREGDVLNITDGAGRRICPPGVVRAIFLKDRVEDGKAVCER